MVFPHFLAAALYFINSAKSSGRHSSIFWASSIELLILMFCSKLTSIIGHYCLSEHVRTIILANASPIIIRPSHIPICSRALLLRLKESYRRHCRRSLGIACREGCHVFHKHPLYVESLRYLLSYRVCCHFSEHLCVGYRYFRSRVRPAHRLLQTSQCTLV